MMIKRPTMIANDVDSDIHNSKENYSCVKFHRTHLQNQNKKQKKKVSVYQRHKAHEAAAVFLRCLC